MDANEKLHWFRLKFREPAARGDGFVYRHKDIQALSFAEASTAVDGRSFDKYGELYRNAAVGIELLTPQ